jgi:2-polyprenyl-3-methyl-5-hydroxy-6-metoxy-1,4-benzoquinol methylase
MSSHLRTIRSGLGYTRTKYGERSWLTLAQVMPSDRSARVLEIGPGDGELIERVRTEGYEHVMAVDMSAEAVEAVRSLGIEAHDVEDTTEWLRQHPGAFDVVVMFHILEHVPKAAIIPLLVEVRSALSAGGVAIIEVPNMGDPFSGVYHRYSDFTHEVGFTDESLAYVLRQAGFSTIEPIESLGATSPLGRRAQRLARRLVHLALQIVSLPNGRQMRRRIGPAIAVRSSG